MLYKYEEYQLQWMIEHGHPLQDLMRELDEYQCRDRSMSGNVNQDFTQRFGLAKMNGLKAKAQMEWNNQCNTK